MRLTSCRTGIREGGHYYKKGGMGMCRGHDPHFSGQSALPSLPNYHQCAAHVPPFSIFAFSALFLAKISALIFQGKPAP